MFANIYIIIESIFFLNSSVLKTGSGQTTLVTKLQNTNKYYVGYVVYTYFDRNDAEKYGQTYLYPQTSRYLVDMDAMIPADVDPKSFQIIHTSWKRWPVNSVVDTVPLPNFELVDSKFSKGDFGAVIEDWSTFLRYYSIVSVEI